MSFIGLTLRRKSPRGNKRFECQGIKLYVIWCHLNAFLNGNCLLAQSISSILILENNLLKSLPISRLQKYCFTNVKWTSFLHFNCLNFFSTLTSGHTYSFCHQSDCNLPIKGRIEWTEIKWVLLYNLMEYKRLKLTKILN